jgi:CubicO group peptidase (beta-lactamase class C family)
MVELLSRLEELVPRAKYESGAPGLSFAVLHEGQIVSAAAGVLSVDTGIEAKPDSLFQVGSITKSLTATLVMQAADEGMIDIDVPVTRYLGMRIGRGPFAETFTARQLMSHTSGLDGDLFLDSGRDDDALAKYMILCHQLDFLSEPGRYYNYSNAGYAVLGRLLEIVHGRVYDRVLQEFLFDRIAARRSTTMPELAAFRRTATGHTIGPEWNWITVPVTHLPRALGPAGLTLYSTAEELAAYAGAHFTGESLISRPAAETMRTPHVALPENASWGLGWKIIPGSNTNFVGHDGGTIGQVASLWTSPGHRLAVAMCTNGGLSRRAWEAVAYPVFREVCGEVPEVKLPECLPDPGDLTRYEGTYDNLGVVIVIKAEGDTLTAAVTQKFFSQPGTTFSMRPMSDHRFRVTLGDDDKVVMQFLDFDAEGRPELFYAGRLHRRIRN